MNLPKLLASSVRQQILRELARKDEIRVMKLCELVETTYNELNRNLAILKAQGIISDDYEERVRHGKIRVIRLNRNNPKTKILLQALGILET